MHGSYSLFKPRISSGKNHDNAFTPTVVVAALEAGIFKDQVNKAYFFILIFF